MERSWFGKMIMTRRLLLNGHLFEMPRVKYIYKKVNRKVQVTPQSQTAANPRHQGEEKKDKNIYAGNSVGFDILLIFWNSFSLFPSSSSSNALGYSGTFSRRCDNICRCVVEGP